MLIEYTGHAVDYRSLLTLLQIGPLGTLRRHIQHVTRLGFQVTYHEATLPLLVSYLQAGQPVIAFVDTGELPHWSSTTNHAVVVVGTTEDHILVNDPAFETAPQAIPVGSFELAWLNCDNACALIGLVD